ncbi:hypothetical protein HK097_006042 [Rhizophlyctis rosea]|uniref:Uncharacterized protein n=1 Tax=Rhizophlyctis rosea TaxID=64517 RepID=A0AAD5SKV7_9FUNG|nr:hypothetical protein HK097_006042 [Rhizophlyctis rosea]
MDLIIILSPTLHLDPQWKAVSGYDNVVGGDVVDNEVLMGIVKAQKQRDDPTHPEENRCLLVIDDSGNDFRWAKLRHMMNVLFTTFRHYGGNLICGIQSLQHMESTQISNSTQWCLFDTNQRSLKKISTDLATARMPEKELEEFIRDNTKRPYSFVFIDYTAPSDQQFRVGFEDVYIPLRMREDDDG